MELAMPRIIAAYRPGPGFRTAPKGSRLPRRAFVPWVRVLASAGVTAGLSLVLTPLGGALAGTITERIAALAALVVGGMAMFGALCWVTGAARPQDLTRLYRGAEAD